jgi:predicted anti-sigma-YlaC factor YlaD
MTERQYTCKEIQELICTHFEEDPDSPRCIAMREHLAHCPDCGRYCDSIDKLVAIYRASAPGFPEHAKEELLKTIGVVRPRSKG